VRVSESFRRVPLEKACAELVALSGGRCFTSGDVLIAELRSAGGGPDAPADGAAVRRVLLSNMTAAHAARILEGLYTDKENQESRVHFGVDPATNSVALIGPEDAVERAVAFLREADVGLEHVMIEANIFAVQTEELQRLGTQLSGASGAFSDISVNLGSLLAGGIRFTRVAGADNVTAFTAMIDVLLATEAAQVVARPFIGVISGEKATVSVTNDRQVAVLSETGFAPVTTTVSSGVQLSFGAVVRPGGMIRLDVSVEESTFVPTIEGAVSEVARARAATIMEVPSGQPVVIGGISLHRSSTSRVGIPGLRDIPLLGWLFGSRGGNQKEAQLIVVVTPRQWQPGLDHPSDHATPVAGQE
jgi:type II secretory pathway component GspD/PulD (secretin)